MDRRAFLGAAALGSLTALFPSALMAQSGSYRRPKTDIVDRIDLNSLDPVHFRHSTLASNSTEPVGLRLVCLFDDSMSIDMNEYKLQLEMMADAVTDPDFRNSIFYPGGPQSLAICFLNLSRLIRIPWIDIRKGEEHKFEILGKEIMDMHKEMPHGPTYLHRGLLDSLVCLKHCPWTAKRSVINMITDGTEREFGIEEDSSMRVGELIKEIADKHETTVNALITTGDRWAPHMEEWARKYYFTKPGHIKKDGSPLDQGFCEIVAHSLTESHINEIYVKKKAMRMAFRRVVLVQVAEIDNTQQRFAVAPAALEV